jgi:hypothetical protein
VGDGLRQERGLHETCPNYAALDFTLLRYWIKKEASRAKDQGSRINNEHARRFDFEQLRPFTAQF